MCEILSVTWPRPETFDRVLPWALEMERLGVAGFGWGVAWQDGLGQVEVRKSPKRMADDGSAIDGLRSVVSRQFLVHVRRPSKLSTVDAADTQPFLGRRGAFAFCHNGHLDQHHLYREALGARLSGQADSEVGHLMLEDRLAQGADPEQALGEIHQTLGGNANFGFLPAHGPLVVYGAHRTNPLWKFRLGDAFVTATGLHSDDSSVFDLVFDSATRRELVHGLAVVGDERSRDQGVAGS